jgi:hypothetical protein
LSCGWKQIFVSPPIFLPVCLWVQVALSLRHVCETILLLFVHGFVSAHHGVTLHAMRTTTPPQIHHRHKVLSMMMILPQKSFAATIPSSTLCNSDDGVLVLCWPCSLRWRCAAFQLYASLVLVVVFVLMYHYAPLVGKTNVLVYVAICSLVGSISVIGVKGLAVGLKLTLNGSSQPVTPFIRISLQTMHMLISFGRRVSIGICGCGNSRKGARGHLVSIDCELWNNKTGSAKAASGGSWCSSPSRSQPR